MIECAFLDRVGICLEGAPNARKPPPPSGTFCSQMAANTHPIALGGFHYCNKCLVSLTSQHCETGEFNIVIITNITEQVDLMYSKQPAYTGKCQSCSISNILKLWERQD